jgi:hypothetical protein
MPLSKSELVVLNHLKGNVGWHRPYDVAVALNRQAGNFNYRQGNVQRICEDLTCMKLVERMGELYRYKGFAW